MKKDWSASELETLVTGIDNGETVAELCVRLNRSKDSVKRKYRDMRREGRCAPARHRQLRRSDARVLLAGLMAAACIPAEPALNPVDDLPDIPRRYSCGMPSSDVLPSVRVTFR